MGVINGRKYDWTTLKVTIPQLGNVQTVTLSSATYGLTRAKTMQYGTGSEPKGFTRGAVEYKQVVIELQQAEADLLRASMGAGYTDYEMDLLFSYADTEAGLPVRSDIAFGCSIVDEDNMTSQGGDANKIRWTLQPSRVVMDTIPAVLPAVF